MSKFGSIVLMAMLLSVHVVQSQNTFSPYTVFGLGEIHTPSMSNNFAMGEVGIGTPSVWHLNNMNPALLTSNTFSVFEIALQGENRNISNDLGSQQAGTAGYKYISFAFPIIPGRWTSNFGITPFSSINYRFNTTIPVENDPSVNTFVDFQGDGGLTEINWSNGIRLAPGLSVGIRSSFVFGFSQNETTSFLTGNDITNFLPSTVNEKTNYKGLTYGFGLAYGTKLGSGKNSIGFGIIYDIAKDLPGSRVVQFQSSTVNGGTIAGDTLAHRTLDDYYSLPAKFGFGVSWIKDNFLTVGIDFTLSDWKPDAGFGSDGERYQQTMSAGIGLEIIPNFDDVDSYLARIRYRVGFKYTQMPYVINGNSIDDFGISFGWSLPVRSVSSLNMAFKIGQRGKVSDNLIKENYLKFVLGATINDRWFVRRKYN